MSDQIDPISFELPQEQAAALAALAADRKVRLSGEVRDGTFRVDAVSFATDDFDRPMYVPVNAPFAVAR